MIILLTIGYERTSDEIIDYFLFHKKEFLRINCDNLKDSDSFSFNYKLNENATTMKIDNVELNLDAKKVIWNRRISKRTNIDRFIDKKFDFDNLRLFSQFVFKEWEAFLKIFVNSLSKNTYWFDYPFVKEDKIDVLLLAQKNGLTIPETIISNSLTQINSNYITKPLSQTVGFKHGDMFYSTYTTIVKKVKHKFLPSLFQKKIDKRYEVRTFYLDGECYSMAIFSQSDKQTAVDFRQYNYKKPNRNVPYKLPEEIEKCIRGLMNDLGLKTGSIDIIKGKDDKYYFLEVNPVGQFGMTSKPCNYNLEKKVFEKLIEYEQNF
ncbi:grasp-with-spasm system ATP-grasp peptide maturase [Flavobacterium sp. HNIBRBA15423]|uniref:grasp-with-spasm system ATP-grasp peptide maturase n=1 Tax=Flavobacterium sp. HNIBRBA15423 TaxID=3458683 RepID=UPI004044E37C